ncbi:teichoic acid biosynthesis protein B [Staphylococcus saccharolyticus]|uniref:Teichoic acid biosynthesis protein B n=2 Tax=Staphylococcus saccharolyticus TaxID=33028 RepID=A0A380H842_9STAP|nr:CDP-glycerol--poly(glycerophosphate) glycerophosphotransferase [Staphylococcus saccharolyticus]TAA97189.1 CDP-glycerol--poly(glycerophosphate) glycerophosphotransferase [Staphylococcus saccharolyticus]TAB01540.1 CDP-glycerol--poly(glycerophosphate) glycerophosphotransferase [Staphylococcus saccharolyticus]SUM74168.1 teichoic acid biosynthesis protein B [Staphylococcus saccharolyticus]
MTLEELKEYNSLETKSLQQSYLLEKHGKSFHRYNTKELKSYEIVPAISQEINEFIFKIQYKSEMKTSSKFMRTLCTLHKFSRKISFNVRDKIYLSIFNISKTIHKNNKNYVLFTSDSKANMSGNFKFIYEEMLKKQLDKKLIIHSIFKPNVADRRSLLDKIKFPYLLGKSKYILFDDYHPMIYKLSFRANQEIVQVWHAVGAFKTVGFSRTGKKGGPFIDAISHRNYSKAYVFSNSDIVYYAEAFGIEEHKVFPTGVPRTDILFDESYKNNVKQSLEAKLPIIKNKKVILFAPTFRGNGHRTAHYHFFKINFSKLARYCEEHQAIVLFKMHPFVRNKLHIPASYSKYFLDISNFREVNDVFFITDILISEYSSLIYEYSVFKKPMLFYAFDLEDYIYTRDFYEPYETFVPEKIVKTFDELIIALENNDYELEKVTSFLNKNFKYQDGKSSERLVKDLFKNFIQ